MKQDLHTAIATEVAKRLGWPDPESVGKGAALPDDVEIVFVDGIGPRFLGHNIASCTHFAGYCLGADDSLGRLELPDREVLYRVGEWPEIPRDMEPDEPLFKLLSVKGYSHAFDEMSFPAAWSYAEWLEKCYVKVATITPRDHRRMGMLAGMCLHFVQDMAVPQHRRNEMLASHAETEAQASKAWSKMALEDKERLLTTCIESAAPWSARYAAQGFMAQPTDKVSRWCWRRKAVVRDILERGTRVTAAVLKHMRP